MHPELTSRLAIVSGSPYVAECAAGLRHVCPADMEANIYDAEAPLVCAPEVANGHALGYSCHSWLFWEVPTETVHLVIRRTDAKPGSVLTALYPGGGGQTRFGTISRLRNELANEAFGISRPKLRGTTCAGLSPSVDRKEYCIAGMERDMFVPLANELTSSGHDTEDSWRHYLGRAKEAAGKVDELGNQLIELGTRRDLRKEAAMEQVGNACGVYTDTKEITFNDEQVPYSTVDEEINSCVAEETVDLVLLTEDTLATLTNEAGQPLSETEITAEIRARYCAGVAVNKQPPFCARPPTELITHKGLGLARTTGSDLSGGAPCATVNGIFMSEDWQPLKLEPLAQVLQQPWASGTGLQAAISSLQLQAREFSWTLKEHGELLMGTLDEVGGENDDVWPACEQSTVPGIECTEQAVQLGSLFPQRVRYPSEQDWLVAIESELERTLWQMGALAGIIPAGVLQKPLPANARYAPAIYARGMPVEVLDSGAGTYLLNIADISAQYLDATDRSMLGALWDASDEALQRWASTATEPWVESAYLYSGPVYLFGARNADVSFSETFDNPQGQAHNQDYTRANLSDWIMQLAQAHAGDSSNYFHSLLTLEANKVSSGFYSNTTREVCPTSDGPVFVYRWDDGRMAEVTHPQPLIVHSECENALSESDLAIDPWFCPSNLVFRPSQCPPSARMEIFWEKDPSVQRVVKALGLACSIAKRTTVLRDGTLPPEIKSVRDLQKLEIWVDKAAIAADNTLSNLALFDVPVRVVEDFEAGRVGSGAVGQGEHGRLLLSLEKAVEGIHAGWLSLGAGFRQLNAAIAGTRLQIEAVDINRRQQLMEVARDKLEINRQLSLLAVKEAQDVLGFATGMIGAAASMNLFGALGATEELFFESTKNSINREYWDALDDMIATAEGNVVEGADNATSQAIVDLGAELPTVYAAVEGALSSVRTATGDALDSVIALHQNQSNARFELARATEADFVEINGKEIPLHVNTVYRRQFDVTQERYERALDTAKRAAYVARLAIEQRLGVRMNTLAEELGPLPPPSSWVDRLCSVQGVDYNKLREADPEAAGGDTFDVAGFADQYVGDYVDQLQEFVDFYNIEYPFKEGTDSAIVSIREDLHHQGQQCVVNGTNLLYESQRLYQQARLEGDVALGGWAVTGCSADLCLDADAGLLLTAALERPLVGPNGEEELSWLTTTNRPEEMDVWDRDPPAAMVYQSVDLKAGTDYVLSWWDLGRTADGWPLDPDHDEAQPYRVAVYAEDWSVVTSSVYEPSINVDQWSPRRVLEFLVPEDGIYHVGWQASADRLPGASLAISGVQLEVMTKVVGPTCLPAHGQDPVECQQ